MLIEYSDMKANIAKILRKSIKKKEKPIPKNRIDLMDLYNTITSTVFLQ